MMSFKGYSNCEINWFWLQTLPLEGLLENSRFKRMNNCDCSLATCDLADPNFISLLCHRQILGQDGTCLNQVVLMLCSFKNQHWQHLPPVKEQHWAEVTLGLTPENAAVLGEVWSTTLAWHSLYFKNNLMSHGKENYSEMEFLQS